MNYWQVFLDLSQKPFFPQILSIINVVLILLTTLVTYLSLRTSIKANELQFLPLLAIYFRGKTMKDRIIRIRNIGKSPAYDIKIESFINIIKDFQHIWRLDLFLSGTNVLVPDEEKDLTLETTDNDKEVYMSEFMVFYLDPEKKHKRNRIGLLLTFRNIEGNYYYSIVETGEGGLFIKPAKKINAWGKLYIGYRKLSENLLLSSYKFKWKFSKLCIKTAKKFK